MCVPKSIPRAIRFAAAALLVAALVLWALVLKSPRPAKSRVIRVLALSPSGSGFAAGTTQGTIHVCETGCRNFEADGSLNDLRFSEEGELVIADGNIRLVKPGTALPSLVRGDRANYGSARFEAGRRRILTINGKGAILAVDLDTGYASSVFCCSSIWGDVEFLDHGRRAIWAGHWPGIWDFAENKLAGRFIAQREFMTFGPIALDSVGGLATWEVRMGVCIAGMPNPASFFQSRCRLRAT